MGKKPLDKESDEQQDLAAEGTEQALKEQAVEEKSTGTTTPTGTRITRRTVHRSSTTEDVDEVVTEDVALWAPEPSAYPKTVG